MKNYEKNNSIGCINIDSPDRGISTNTASSEVIYRTQTCIEGEIFYVSFMGIFDGRMDEVWLYHDFGSGPGPWELGIVGGYGFIGITTEEQGEYWFGCYVVDEYGNLYFEYRLCVILMVVRPVTQWMNDSKKDICSSSLVCIREKGLIWKSRMLVLA